MSISSSTLLKRDKLDYLLLHMSSLLGIIFIFIQNLVGGIKALLLFFPLIIFVIILPIYVGYIRGVIILNSIIERARGWSYLFIGTNFYIMTILVTYIGEYYSDANTFMAFMPVFLASFLLYISAKKFIKNLLKVYEVGEIKDYEITQLQLTWAGSIGLGLSFSNLVYYLDKGIFNIDTYSKILFFSFPLLILFFHFEYKSRKMKEIASIQLSKKQKKKKNILSWFFFILLIGLLILQFVIPRMIVKDSILYPVITNLLFGGTMSLLLWYSNSGLD